MKVGLRDKLVIIILMLFFLSLYGNGVCSVGLQETVGYETLQEAANTVTQESVESANLQGTDNSVEKSSFIRRVTDWYMNNINYYTITLLMTVESSFIPFPSEVVLPPAAWKAAHTGELNLILIFLCAMFGAITGALINYFLSISLGRVVVYKLADTKLAHLLLINREKIEKAEKYFVDHGKSSTFIGRLVPGIRQLISIPAGLSKMNLGQFIGYTSLGAGLWNIILIALGYFLYSQQELLMKVYNEIKIGLLILGAAFVLYLIISSVLKNKRKK